MSFPPGEWSPLLVGDQWPDDHDLMALSDSKINRGNIKAGYTRFADMLRNTQTGPLAEQRGHTADDLRNTFCQGENHALRVAEKNNVKETAYGSAYDSMLSLRHDLAGLAEDGNNQIKEIQHSKQPTETKVTQIVTVIHQCRALANLAAAKYGGNVLDAIQRILDNEGTGQSGRQFAQAQGIDIDGMFRRPDDQKDLEGQVRSLIINADSEEARTTGDQVSNIPNPGPGFPTEPAPPQLGQPGGKAPAELAYPTTVTTRSAPSQLGASGAKAPTEHVYPTTLTTGSMPTQLGEPGGTTAPGLQGSSTPPNVFLGHAPAPATTAPAVLSGSTSPLTGAVTPGLPTTPQPPASPLASAPLTPTGPTPGVTPTELMHSFDKGMQAGAPLAAAADAVPPAPMSPTEPHAPPAPLPTTQAAAAQAHVPVFDTPAPVQHAPVAEAPPSPVVAAPPAPAAPTATPPATGPLPAYASDLRPTSSAATVPAAAPSPSLSATPGSAPVHPSAGQAGTGQPAVVRQTPPPKPTPPPSSLGAQAVAATATGAVAGAGAAQTDATVRARLQRLINAVARQQPQLAWAAGDRADNTTVLVTDLASGWIPPGIDLPAAVTLLQPALRRGNLETLLGDVSVTASYTPIHHVPDEDEPVPTSPRARHAPDIAELGWQLSQATQWRDGLPRLAHTLAKAASTGTGVLDSEVELLHQHLATISARVLDSYPGSVDADQVGNWQLLAAIDALVAGDKTAANYHLAWFEACGATTEQARN